MPDGRRIRRRHRTVAHDREQQVCDFELVYYVTHPERTGRTTGARVSDEIPVPDSKWSDLLARTGFEVEHLYADYDKSPFGSKLPRASCCSWLRKGDDVPS